MPVNIDTQNYTNARLHIHIIISKYQGGNSNTSLVFQRPTNCMNIKGPRKQNESSLDSKSEVSPVSSWKITQMNTLSLHYKQEELHVAY